MNGHPGEDLESVPEDTPIDGSALTGILTALEVVLANAPDDAYDGALGAATAVLDTLAQRVDAAHRRRTLTS